MREKRTVLKNGKIITETEVLQNFALILCGNTIDEIIPQSKLSAIGDGLKLIDCSNQYILPGLIDIHSDMIEHIIVPRKGLVFDYSIALFEADRQLINQGITTIFHSVSIANSTICNRKRTLSVPEMIGIGDAICQYDPELLIHHRFHARLELNTIEAFEDIAQRILQGNIHELSLMNHTPGQGQYASLNAFKLEIKKQYGEVSEARMAEIIRECREKPLLSQAKIDALLEYSTAKRIPIAFHDVETENQLEFMRKHNIRISEFPLNANIAAKVSGSGFFNLVGAPNILKKKSHNNNASAIELLENGWAKIICSDYFSPALLLSVFMLPKVTDLSLPETVRFATYYPAQAVNIDRQYGSIAPGKNADIIVVDDRGVVPKVVLAFVDGKQKLNLFYGGHYNESGCEVNEVAL